MSLEGVCTVTASTKRSGVSGGRSIGPTANLTSLKIMPLMPVSPEVVERYKLNSPRKSFYTGASLNPDVKEGDVLVIGSAEYIIRAVEVFTAPVAYTGMIVEAVK